MRPIPTMYTPGAGVEIKPAIEKRERRGPAKTPRRYCLACGKKLRRAGRWTEARTGKEWGDYGDNTFCGLRCGYDYAIAVTRNRGNRSEP